MPSVAVTGAARGLGYQFLQYFAAKPDYQVFGLVRRNKADTDAKLSKDGITNVTIIEADITDAPALEKAAEQVSQAAGGKLDLLINNAAILGERSRWKPMADMSASFLDEEMTACFRTNVIGVAFATNAFLPLIKAGQQKKVITLATGLADVELTNQLSAVAGGPYSISKAATNMLVAKYNAAYGASEGILFLALSPGLVDTDMNASGPKDEEAIKGEQAMVAAFMKFAPDFKGPITPEESVNSMMEVVDKATVESMGGAFVSHHGDKNWL
ncbi:uncharacterized protein LTR77_001626 [Saxophila tyrrhenica]|uniref:NAD(P)-binding protein n=1 Tax=Saxophila tyrrhenica TaxID=1690608 RepID=A0AAV9PLL6_9PEZI|nr:hypothetical protein LTR77_001626 [Saxophila tyrrhenica]